MSIFVPSFELVLKPKIFVKTHYGVRQGQSLHYVLKFVDVVSNFIVRFWVIGDPIIVLHGEDDDRCL